jgi:hypothetical protein
MKPYQVGETGRNGIVFRERAQLSIIAFSYMRRRSSPENEAVGHDHPDSGN